MTEPLSKELEKQILTFITYAVPRATTGISLREEDLRAYKKIVPEYFRFMRTQTVKSHIAFIASNRNDPYFGPYVEKMLTPEGIRWLERNIPMIIRVGLED